MTSLGQNSSENTVLEETASITSKISNPRSRSGSLKARLCNYGDLPYWLQDNHDILKGYRIPTFSYVNCVKSLFYIHNESGKLMDSFVIRNHKF